MSNNKDLERMSYINYIKLGIGWDNVKEASSSLFIPNNDPESVFRVLAIPDNDEQLEFAKRFWQVRRELLSKTSGENIRKNFDFKNSDLFVVLDLFLDFLIDKSKQGPAGRTDEEMLLDFTSEKNELFQSLGFYDDNTLFSKILSEMNISIEYFMDELLEYTDSKLSVIKPKMPTVVHSLMEIISAIVRQESWNQQATPAVLSKFIEFMVLNREIVLEGDKGKEKQIKEAQEFLTYFTNYLRNIGPQRKKDENNA